MMRVSDIPADRTVLPVPEDADVTLRRVIGEILSRRPAVGLALGLIRDGRLATFRSHGLADVASRTPITEDTCFRIGSITKLFTAIAIMQLWEQGVVDLDAPASDSLRAFRLVAANPGFRPATVRHLLTHTAGVPEVLGLADLRYADLTPSGGRPAGGGRRRARLVPLLGAVTIAGASVMSRRRSRMRRSGT